MYIHQVIATGKSFKRASWSKDSHVTNENSKTYKFTQQDLVAADWIVYVPVLSSVSLTKERLLDAFKHVYGMDIDWSNINAYKKLCSYLGFDV